MMIYIKKVAFFSSGKCITKMVDIIKKNHNKRLKKDYPDVFGFLITKCFFLTFLEKIGLLQF